MACRGSKHDCRVQDKMPCLLSYDSSLSFCFCLFNTGFSPVHQYQVLITLCFFFPVSCVVMQLEHVIKHKFALDYSYSLLTLQAFVIALSRFDRG